MFKKDSKKVPAEEKKPDSNNLESDQAENAESTKAETQSEKEQSQPQKAPEGQMFIKVYSPFKKYYEALGVSISATNDTGEFDILAGHHKFLTLLSACEISIATNEGDGEKIKIDKGIMYVKEDRVTVFLDV